MTHCRLDFALDHTSVGDAAVLSGLQAGQRLVLRQQQQEQQRLQATQNGAEPTTVGAAAEPTSAVADIEEQHASSGPQSAASGACTESAGTSEPLANAATAVAAAAAIALEQPQPQPPQPAASSVLHVCDGSGQVLGIVPAAAAKRLPPRVDLAAVQVREGGHQGKHRLARPWDLTQPGALFDVVVAQRAPCRCGSGLSRSTRSMAFKRCSCVSRSPLQAVGQRQVRWGLDGNGRRQCGGQRFQLKPVLAAGVEGRGRQQGLAVD